MVKLERSLGLLEVSLMSIGIILGAGVYVLIGEAIGLSGNALWISFIFAAIALLGVSNKKTMSFQELKQIIKVFDTDLSKDEKTCYINKSKDPKVNSLQRMKDSLAFFCIRKY